MYVCVGMSERVCVEWGGQGGGGRVDELCVKVSEVVSWGGR